MTRVGPRIIHREHLAREREGDEERFQSLSGRARSLALSLAEKTDWSNTCTVAATAAAERIATSSSRSNSSAAGAANSNKNSSLLHTHQNNHHHHHHHHHVRRRSCSRYQIPSHYPHLPRNVSVLDECSERSKATMATNATPLSLARSLFVCLFGFFFFFFPPLPLFFLFLLPCFLPFSSYLFSIFVVCE